MAIDVQELGPTRAEPPAVPPPDPGALLERLEALTAEIEALPDPRARELADELIGTVIAMYGDGLRRIIDTIGEARDAGATILDALAQDGAVSSLLLIHDLYPVSLEERVREALDTVRPYMESHGGNVALVSLEDGVARLALEGSCNGCAASRATLELAIKQALEEHCPDLAGLEVEGVTDAEPAAFALPIVQSAADGTSLPMAPTPPVGTGLPMAESARWIELGDPAPLGDGELRTIDVAGASIVLADVAGTLLAYHDRCAACGDPLHAAPLEDGIVACPACGGEFDLRRAGRALGNEPLQLTPVPLLSEGGVRVAL